MKGIVGAWRNWNHARKFVRVGKRCRFLGKFLEVDGHVELGDYCKIRNNVILRTNGDGRIFMGERSGLSYYCLIEATTIIKIGRFTGIAEFTVIRDTNHLVFGTAEHWRVTPYIAEPIVIGDCVAVMSGSYICPGVAIGDGAIVGQRSVVTKDVGPFEVWAGNPARKLGHRTEGPLAESMSKRYAYLLDGWQAHYDAYEQELKEIQSIAAQGINRAAQERDRLMTELKQCRIPQNISIDD